MTRKTSRIIVSLALTATFGLAAWSHAVRASAPSPTDVTPVAVTIDNFKFSTASLEVPKGTRVTWTNQDDVPHTVTSTTKAFKSSMLDTGDQFSFTFTDAGTYEYFCSMHPKMTAKVVVK